jgi:hypothetical protein
LGIVRFRRRRDQGKRLDLTVIVIVVVVTALAFDFTNGFHDTANAMATSIATVALIATYLEGGHRLDIRGGRGSPPGHRAVGRRGPDGACLALVSFHH